MASFAHGRMNVLFFRWKDIIIAELLIESTCAVLQYWNNENWQWQSKKLHGKARTSVLFFCLFLLPLTLSLSFCFLLQFFWDYPAYFFFEIYIMTRKTEK